MSSECQSNIEGKDLIVIADSCSIIFNNLKNRIKDTTGLIRISKNQFRPYYGLLLHANLVFDANTYYPHGVIHSEFISRSVKSRIEKGEKQKRNNQYIEEKESYKWLKGFEQSRNLLKVANHITLVADREGDIIELFDRLSDEKTDVVIRTSQNRNIINEKGEKQKIKELLSGTKSKGQLKVKIESNARKKRIAKLEVKSASVTLPWAKWKKVGLVCQKDGVKINIVEVREKQHKGKKGEPPLVWQILTTLPVNDLSSVLKVVEIYKKRWLIEEYFKLLKTDCYDIENTELTKGENIRKLLLYIMKASLKIQRLKAARNGEVKQELTSTFSNKEIECLHKLNPTLQGNTEKQKNPYPPSELAYASWIIARLGGWKEYYNASRPPGTKTFAWGLEKFENIMFAKTLFEDVS